MVIDKVGGENIARYLAYDIIKFEGYDVGEQSFYPTRMGCIEHEIIAPRHQAIQKGIINKSKEPFSVRKKDFWDVTQASSLLGERFAKTLSHEPDGLIFQPSNEVSIIFTFTYRNFYLQTESNINIILILIYFYGIYLCCSHIKLVVAMTF